MITFDGVTKSYGGRRVVGPLSFEVAKGAFVALLGASGCGKTTTLKMINGLVTPGEGRILVDGAEVGAEPLPLLRRRIGYVFQDVGLFPHMTIAENIAVGPRLAGWPAARAAARTAELLDLIALPAEVGARAPAALSGGQRQRVGVARALAAGPQVMLMDEPFGALDPVTRDTLGHDYRALHERLGLTTVMVTHDVMEALFLADRIIVMDAGRIVADGGPAALFDDPPDGVARALMETPRRQARRLEALAREPGAQDRGHG
jgi:osmoprotectant transport system ATP-binding protein